MFKRMQQLQNLWIEELVLTKGKKFMADLCNLCVGSQCCIHNGGGGLRWALWPHCQPDSDQFMKVMHVIVESVRNGYSWLVDKKHLLVEHTEWVEKHYNALEVRELYEALGFAGDVLEGLVLLHPDWIDGHLVCNRAFLEAPGDRAAEYENLLLCLWNFSEFTDSRFATIGTSMRTLTAASVLGLPAYVEMAIQDGAKPYYLQGYRQFGRQQRSLKLILI